MVRKVPGSSKTGTQEVSSSIEQELAQQQEDRQTGRGKSNGIT
ncbi:hypothetical protein RCO48_09270 [Peribacillus frigoritolerans]|nr:hypothetical protein [Peribacillus frigoritolerans]